MRVSCLALGVLGPGALFLSLGCGREGEPAVTWGGFEGAHLALVALVRQLVFLVVVRHHRGLQKGSAMSRAVA